MRSIIGYTVVAASSAVVCYRIFSPYIRRRMTEIEKKRNLEENNQFWDNYYANRAAKNQHLLFKDLDERIDDLDELLYWYKQDSTNVQILKKLSACMTDLVYYPTWCAYEQIQMWLYESKSLLEKALAIDKNDDSIKFELGRAHYNILWSDINLTRGSDAYMEHCRCAYRYFKEVEDKGPEVYITPMLDELRKLVSPFISDLEVNIDGESFLAVRIDLDSSSELYHDNTEQNKKEYGDSIHTMFQNKLGDSSNTPSADVVCG